MASNIPTKLSSLPGVVVIYDRPHALNIILWTHTDYTLVYSVVGNLENFDPTVKYTVKVPTLDTEGSPSPPRDFYGMAKSGKITGGRIEIQVANLSSSQADVNLRVPGDTLIGTYKDTITIATGDWLSWKAMSPNARVHRTQQTILEVCESADTNPVPPGGVICAEYERNADGTVKTDSNGNPKIALVDQSQPNSPANLKLGHLVLTFEQDFFGTGVHAWTGGAAGSSRRLPFDLILTAREDSALYDLDLWPGTLNQLVPTNMFSTFTYNPTTSVFVSLACLTNGKQVTSCSIEVGTSAPSVIGVLENAAPSSFSVVLGVVLGDGTVGTVQQIQNGNFTAATEQALVQEKASPEVGLSPWIYWWTWEVTQI